MGKIFCITGPSGAGKSTLARFLEEGGINEIVSYTTRKPRVGEVDGVNYHYVTKEVFMATPMVEVVEYDGNFYGTSKQSIEDALAKDGYSCIVVEINGYNQLKEICGKENIGCIFVYCHKDMIEKRLIGRGDSPEKIKTRLSLYDRDMGGKVYADYTILNSGTLEVLKASAKLVIKNPERVKKN